MAASAIKIKSTSSFIGYCINPLQRKQTREYVPPKMGAFEPQPWTPADSETDPERESKLMQEMEKCMTRLENSEFYKAFLDKMKTPEVLNYFCRILISETKMQMVIYGIGSIESCKRARLQLALAILIKRSFDWIGDIEVFDPVLSKIECEALEGLGCSVLLINERARRKVSKPTMFFMPHCGVGLYDNLLQANWCAENLNQMVLFGNSFKCFKTVSLPMDPSMADSAKFVFFIRRFLVEVDFDIIADEVGIHIFSADFFKAFLLSSWHFFQVDPQQEAQLQALKP